MMDFDKARKHWHNSFAPDASWFEEVRSFFSICWDQCEHGLNHEALSENTDEQHNLLLDFGIRRFN
jgi:hypothetical protein